ncbi:MAG: triose-phosphate isomerase [Candidatus Aenigmatarchaeota archaeon]
MKTPILIVNLKQYEQALGCRPLDFAITAKKLAEKHDVTILIAPPAPLIDSTAKICMTISQHIDPYEPGAYTGSLIAKEVKELGGVGSLINHSEKRIPHEDIKKCVELCRKYELVSIVCAKDNYEVMQLAKFKPDFIAIEPPELIGGDVSVSTARPDVIKKSVEDVKELHPGIEILCGAGVKNRMDVKKAIYLGAKGVLVASGVVKSDDIEKSMEELIMGMV